ncbi:MAG: DinB family protein [Bryobacteraceae bacterium]|jgi:uncharacterized damage-inducible protein DinB
MTIGEMLLPEFDRETASTRKILERVPEDKFAWKPHQKSSTLGKLASHLAAIPGWAAVVVNGHGKKSPDAASKAELLEVLDRNIAAGREALATANDDYLSQNIRVGADLSKPRAAILRERLMSHMIHHRGQLSVYLRLLDVAVPGMYGPSADEK